MSYYAILLYFKCRILCLDKNYIEIKIERNKTTKDIQRTRVEKQIWYHIVYCHQLKGCIKFDES